MSRLSGGAHRRRAGPLPSGRAGPGFERSVAALECAEPFQSSDDGKLVVVVEAASSAGVVETIDAMRELPGVLNVSLVYQHAEPASSLEQEIDP